MNIAKALRQFARTSNGSITVEFVAILPLLLITLAFSFEFGYALWTYDVATRDVRAATRYLARTNPLDPAAAATMAKSGLPAATTVSTFCSGSCTSPPIRTFVSGSSYRQNGEVIQVQASVPLALPLLGFLGVLGVPTAYTLVVADQARRNDVGD